MICEDNHPQNQEQIDIDGDNGDLENSNVASTLENKENTNGFQFRKPFPYGNAQVVDIEDNIPFHTIETISSQRVISMCQIFSQEATADKEEANPRTTYVSI